MRICYKLFYGTLIAKSEDSHTFYEYKESHVVYVTERGFHLTVYELSNIFFYVDFYMLICVVSDTEFAIVCNQ